LAPIESAHATSYWSLVAVVVEEYVYGTIKTEVTMHPGNTKTNEFLAAAEK